MSRSYCVDTNIALLLARGQELGKQIDESYGLRSAPQFHTISIVSHGELYAMADRRQWGPDRFLTLAKTLAAFVTVDVAGARIVEAYREIEKFNAAVPTGAVKMGKNDIWIAATAIVAEQPLITTDTDFDHLNGALLEVFWVNPNVHA